MTRPTRNASATAAATKPNILVIFGDDVGQTNISAYAFGVVGYKTPNIDRIANEGMMFTDYYAENSCTAGRSTFITGQAPLRTGLSKVGMPGVRRWAFRRWTSPSPRRSSRSATPRGNSARTISGDKNEYLPTMHGFDEFFGNLYHLNAEEEPEQPYWPKDPNDPIRKHFTPRGVLKCKATDKDDSTVDPRLGKVGKQTIEDTGPLTASAWKRSTTKPPPPAIDFMQRQVQGGQTVLHLDEHHAHACLHPCA